MRSLIYAVVLVMLSGWVVADEPAPPAPVCVWADSTPASDRIRAVLGKPISDNGLEFQETPLEEIVAFLSDEYAIEIQIDRAALDELGVAPEEPVTVQVRNVSLRAGIDLMLEPLGLAWTIEHDVLVITSQDEALAKLRTAVYPVSDLLHRESVSGLTAALVSCAPGFFKAEGGEGMIVPYDESSLVITVDQATHEKVAGVLKALREAKKHSPPQAESTQNPASSAGREFDSGFGGRGEYGSAGENPFSN